MLSFLLACAVLLAPFASNASWGYVQAAAAESDGEVDYSTEYVVLSLEGFTLGQGFYIEPERMSYKEIGEVWKEEGIDIDLSKLTVSQATYAFFKKEGLETEPSGTDKYNSSSYYLANVKGIDKGAANVPQELKDAYQKKNGKALELKDKTGKDLGQFDYFSMSGWMNTVDNIMGNVGAGEYQVDSAAGVDNTHVIRWQFTLADYGADLGYGYNPDKNTFDSEYAYYETQDKTELYVLYAEHADEIAKDEALREEVQAVMTDLTATADEVQAVEKKISGDKRNTVSVTMNYSAPYMTLADSEGNEIEVGEPDGSKYTLELEPGTYRLSAYQKSGDEKTDMGSIDLVVTDDPQQSYSIYSITDIACTGYDTVDGNKKYWKEDVDYTVTGKVMSPDNVDRHAEFVKTREGSDGAWAKYAGLFYYADMVSVTYDPVGDRADDYISKTVSNTLTSNRSYGYSVALAAAKTDFVQVKLDVVDGATNEAVEGYKVSIKDTEGNPVTVKDGSFNGLAGRQYNYTMKCAGYMYAEGTFEIPEDTSGEMSQTISLTASSATAWDGESKTEPEQVDGVYQISTGAELYWFENEVNVNKKVDINAVLTADINLAGYSWTPIGTSGAIYMGSFDGQGHTISNLYQNDIGYSGIFGQAGARISSLTVEGTIIMSTKTAAGAVVGYLYQGTTDAPARVAGCTSKVNITYTGTNTSASIGGLVGYCNTNKISNTVIENCVNHGTIKAENGGTVGGIIGSMSSRNICVQNSTNYGDITAKTNVGGILGSHNEYYPQDPGCKIISCYNAGTITGQTNAGGIAGVFKGNTSNDAGVEITDCYSAGTVNGSDTATTGVFAGYSEDLTISGSAYSCTAAADESITEDQASYVSAANIEAVKKLTVDTVTKINDGEAILNVAPAAEIMANVPLTAEDGEFVETYKKVRTVIDGVTIFNIGVYDYTASAAGINGASKDGVILENTKVEAASAVDAVKRALDNAGIAYDIQESAYGPYIVSVNGLASVADYSMSGWMLSYNGDDFDNGGLGSLDAKDNDTIELHYELTGADVAASFSGLPTFESMTIDGTEITFTTETETDENWNSIYTYKANGEVLNGTGTKADPFEVGVVLPESADLVKLDMTYKTTADGHYVVVDGLSAKINLTNDVVCRITSRGGRTAWYKIMAVTALTEDNTKLEIADAEYTGEELTPEVTVYVNDKKLDPSSYEVTYSDNVNAGKGTCTVKGTGKFSGTIQGEFEIKKSTKTITTEKTEIEVLENEEPFDLEVTGQGTLTFASSAPEVAEVDPETGRVTVKAVGETEITVSSEGTENYEAGQIVIKITVKEVPVEPEEPDTKVTLTKDNTVIEVADVTYTGKAQKPEVTVTVDGKKLEAADYTASYANNVNAGTAKVTITGKNDYTGSVEQTFKINKADQTVTGNTLYVYNRYITVKAAGKGTVTYSSTNKNIAIVNSKSGLVRTKKPGRVQIKITVSGNSNYNKASGIVTLIVTPAKSSITKLASNSSRSLKVTYKKVSGATGYQITYATNKNFKSAKTKYVSAKYGSATIKNLAKNKRYYVRVRAYKTINGKRYMGLGSSVKSVKVK